MADIVWQVRDTSGEVPGPWLDAVVPGSLAASPDVVRALGEETLADADHRRWCWRGRVALAAPMTDARLTLDGLATHADVTVDGRPVLRSDNAFRRHVLDLGDLDAGEHEILVDVGAFEDNPVPRKPRPRWRSALVPDASLRWRRTPLLGRITSWPGTLPPVGILGGATLEARPAAEIRGLRTALADGRGVLHLELAGHAPRPARVEVAGASADVVWTTTDHGVSATVDLTIDDVEPWWPHHLGHPALHDLTVLVDGAAAVHRRVGFARITARREAGRFALSVNGVDDFVRGVCWVPVDARGWAPSADAMARDMDRLVRAGITLLRVTGTSTYEGPDFRRLAAERGLLVWQEAMLATFDPPEDEAWLADLEAELRDQLTAWQGWPHLAVVAGGTETEQQPTLMGVPADRRRMTAIHDLLPRLAAELVPGAVHVTSSPSGGPRPVSIAHGVSHYFGVGAYLRPLEDARTAQVSFASEALAFGIPPESSSMTGPDVPAERGRGSAWRQAAPHDRGVEWDFVDVTDHYVDVVADAERVAEDVTDQERWEDLERLAATTAITETMAGWRSSLTPTGGGIVLSHRDLAPGPGWGLLDSTGAPKAPLLALRDVLAPVALLLVDRGLDGLLLEAVNDTGEPVSGALELVAQDRHGNPVLEATVDVEVPPRGRVGVEVEEVLGGFRDLGWAWRFGPEPGYSCLDARWTTGGGVIRATRTLCPLGAASSEPAVQATAREAGSEIVVDVLALRATRGVHAAAAGWCARDGWWALPAEGARRLVLEPARPGVAPPSEVVVHTLDGPPVRVTVESGAASD